VDDMLTGRGSQPAMTKIAASGKEPLRFMNPSSAWLNFWDSLENFGYDIEQYVGSLMLDDVSDINI
jgi:hypothetical protein